MRFANVPISLGGHGNRDGGSSSPRCCARCIRGTRSIQGACGNPSCRCHAPERIAAVKAAHLPTPQNALEAIIAEHEDRRFAEGETCRNGHQRTPADVREDGRFECVECRRARSKRAHTKRKAA